MHDSQDHQPSAITEAKTPAGAAEIAALKARYDAAKAMYDATMKRVAELRQLADLGAQQFHSFVPLLRAEAAQLEHDAAARFKPVQIECASSPYSMTDIQPIPRVKFAPRSKQ